MYTHKYIRTHFHTNKLTYIYIYICTHTYMHTHTYTYIQMTEPYMGRGLRVCDALFSPPLEFPRRIVPRLATEYALYRFRAITHLSWTQVHFLLIIEDRVCYLTLIGKHSLLVPSRLHCCDDSCFARCLFADFTQCPCVALLQRSCCRELNS